MVCHVPMHHTRHAALMPAATNRSTGKTVYSEIGLLFDLLQQDQPWYRLLKCRLVLSPHHFDRQPAFLL